MKTFLRFNVFQLLLIAVVGFFFQNSYSQVAISSHNVNVTTALNGWNGTLPAGFTMTGGGDYKGTAASTAGGVYAIVNAGFGYQASSGVASVDLKGTYKNTTGSTITSLLISYRAFSIVARDSRTPGWAVTSSLGSVSALNWTYNINNSVANPVTKTITLNNLDIANNSTFTLTFSSDRGNGTGSSPLIGLSNIILKSIVSASISTNPTTLAFGNTEINSNSAAQTAAITATSLTSNITATAPDNFEVSSNGTSWSDQVTLPTTGGTLHVRFSPESVGLLTGNITLSSAGATNKLIAVSGTSIETSASITTNTTTFGPFCNAEANTFDVDFTKTGTFTGTNFSVQLSDASGTFSSTATNIIGTSATSPISATIPANTIAGTNYRIRVLNENPLTFSNNNGSDIIINPLVTPDFATIPDFCSGYTAPVLALTSPNGIAGTWNPSTVSNTQNGTYVFTPNAGQCASTVTLTTTVTPLTVPDFATIPDFCSGSTAPVLAMTSPNGIAGTWNPSTVSNTQNGSYVFTPNAGQCASAVTLTTTVTPLTVPDFATIPDFCSGSTAPILALTSPNGIAGTWNPSTVSNTQNGTYVFTPNAGQCASTVTLTTIVTPLTVPDFATIPDFCSGSTAPVLALTSPNGIAGTWNPSTVSNTQNGTYVFTPNAGQCASTVTLTIIVNATLPPTGNATQDFTTGQTLGDFIVSGENIKWYDAVTGGNELQNSLVISTGTIYYASQTINGCESPSRLQITAGIDLGTDSFKASQLKYYPNPVDQILNLEYTQEISSVTVFNLLGQQVLIANPNNTVAKIDLSNLNSGTYFVNINSENNSKTVKVIKK